MQCNRCGLDVRPKSATCPRCGFQLVPTPPPLDTSAQAPQAVRSAPSQYSSSRTTSDVAHPLSAPAQPQQNTTNAPKKSSSGTGYTREGQHFPRRRTLQAYPAEDSRPSTRSGNVESEEATATTPVPSIEQSKPATPKTRELAHHEFDADAMPTAQVPANTPMQFSPQRGPAPQQSNGSPDTPFASSGIRPLSPSSYAPPMQHSPGGPRAPQQPSVPGFVQLSPGGPIQLSPRGPVPSQALSGSPTQLSPRGPQPLSAPGLVQLSPNVPLQLSPRQLLNGQPAGVPPAIPFTPALSAIVSQPLAKPTTNTLASQKVHQQKRVVTAVIVLLLSLLVLMSGVFVLNKVSTRSSAIPTKPRVHVSPTPTLPALTTTDPNALYTQARGRQAILSDSLHTQSNNNWQGVNSTGNCAFESGALTVDGTGQDQVAVCLAANTQFTNFAFQSDVTIQQGDTAGLIFRADSLGHRQYLFGITSSGTYTLSYINEPSDTEAHIIASGTSTAIVQGTGKVNHLTVIAQHTTLYLYSNDQFITQVTDSTYSAGSIGVFAGNAEGNIYQAVFANVKVWQV